MVLFTDRFAAAKRLAKALQKYKNDHSAIILAVPRGALQIGRVLVDELGLLLDIFIAKKISMLGNEELAIGAVAQGGVVELDKGLITMYNVPEDYLKKETARLNHIVQEKYTRYTGKTKPPSLKGKTVILCDDGIATGHTLVAAVKAIRKQQPKKIIVAVPVASREGFALVQSVADEVLALEIPESFFAIGQFYEFFPQVEDEEAIALLKGKKK